MNKKRKYTSPEDAAREWVALKDERFRIDKRLDELKQVLEPYLNKQPAKSVEIAGWKFSLVEMERENFRLSEAKLKISEKVLAPFISLSSFSQIRTIWRGGEVAAA